MLPQPFKAWFEAMGWTPHAHQLALLETAKQDRSVLLIAPTGGGKTLAGFLPSLTDLANRKRQPKKKRNAIHTVYVSPLKALAVDIARNLDRPVEEMGLDIRIETRTGDTKSARRQRQRIDPPDILITTPEQIALMLSHESAFHLFAELKFVILDELHALSTSKRGDLLSLGLARLRQIAPTLQTIGLSATVSQPSELRAYLVGQPAEKTSLQLADFILTREAVKPEISILETTNELPWTGHSGNYALQSVYDEISRHRLVLIFVNTRSQAERTFRNLWHINDLNLPIALHHGSLDSQRRRKVEAAMAQGTLRAVVSTSTLDLGVDWGDVDLVINLGAPKGASRLQQRIGRANHRLDEPSRALLVPSNLFEVLECRAALDASTAGIQDTKHARNGALDVLAQHVMGMASARPIDPEALFKEVRSAAPYNFLSHTAFTEVIEFVKNGGYALTSYDRFARLRPTKEGHLRPANRKVVQQYRLNVGTIVEAPMLKVRLARKGRSSKSSKSRLLSAGGRVLGEIEEGFIEQLAPGDTFTFAGEILQFEGLRETDCIVTRAQSDNPKIPIFQGGKFPLSTHLADGVRTMLATPKYWHRLPHQVADWLRMQKDRSILPGKQDVLVETFPRNKKHYLVCYPFEGRLVHQTLGMILTRRLERARAKPLGFVANDYGLALWGLENLNTLIADKKLSLQQLFDEDMMGDDLEAWLAETSLIKRAFRQCAIIAGLIERRYPGQEKSGRQVTFSSDLIYDVLRAHEPHHILLKAAWVDIATGALDMSRLGDFLARIKGRIRHKALHKVSPLSVPILLEIGREPIHGEADEYLLYKAANDIIIEAMGHDTIVGETHSQA